MPTRREQLVDDWLPDRKVVAAAIAAVAAWLLQETTGVVAPPGIEAAVAVIVAYVVPSTRRSPLDG